MSPRGTKTARKEGCAAGTAVQQASHRYQSTCYTCTSSKALAAEAAVLQYSSFEISLRGCTGQLLRQCCVQPLPSSALTRGMPLSAVTSVLLNQMSTIPPTPYATTVVLFSTLSHCAGKHTDKRPRAT